MSNVVINPYSFASADTELITRWTLADAGDLDLELWGLNFGTSTYNFSVDWGDGSTIETGITVSNKSHTYASTGTYTVKIGGQFAGFYMARGSAADKAKLVEFVQWGSETEINGLYQAFYQCTNMVYSATDAPDLSNLSASTWLYYTFYQCSSITSLDLTGWTNTDNITNLFFAFNGVTACTLLNLTGWDVSNVILANQAFRQIGSATALGTGANIVMPDLDWTGATDANNLYQMFVNTEFSVAPTVTGWTLPPGHNAQIAYMFYQTHGAFVLDLTGWTNTNKISSMSNFAIGAQFTSIDITGWTTSSCTSYTYAFNSMPNLTHITGLSTLDTSSVVGTGYVRMFGSTSKLTFGAAGSATNFGVNWGPNMDAGDCSYMFHTTGATGGSPYGQPPYVANWDTSEITTMYQMFVSTYWSASLDFSNWDLSGLTVASGMMYFLHLNKGTTVVDFTNADLPSTINNMTNTFYNNDVTTVTWGSGCDFSNVTTFSQHCNSSDVTSYSFATNADFTALAIGTNFLTGSQTMGTANYDNFLIRMDATNSTAAPGTLTMGASTYTGGGEVATARAALVTAGWTITDGGIA